MRLVLVIIFLLCLSGCDRYYKFNFNGKKEKVYDMDCGTIIITSGSLELLSFHYRILIKPEGRTLVRFDDIHVFVDRVKRSHEICFGDGSIIKSDSLFIEHNTELYIYFTRDVKDVNEIGIVSDNFLTVGSNVCEFGPIYQKLPDL